MKKLLALLPLAVLLSTPVFAKEVAKPIIPSGSTLSQQEQVNQILVYNFYTDVFTKHKVKSAVSQYIGDKYIQHNPHLPDGGAAFSDYFVDYFKKNPFATNQIKTIITQGDYVVLHVLSKQKPTDRGSAIVDIFRVENGKIVEHWDVNQAIPAESANSNSMF